MSKMLTEITRQLGPSEAVEFFVAYGAGKAVEAMKRAALVKAKELFVHKCHLEAVTILLQMGLVPQARDFIKRALSAHPETHDPIHRRLLELQEEARPQT